METNSIQQGADLSIQHLLEELDCGEESREIAARNEFATRGAGAVGPILVEWDRADGWMRETVAQTVVRLFAWLLGVALLLSLIDDIASGWFFGLVTIGLAAHAIREFARRRTEMRRHRAIKGQAARALKLVASRGGARTAKALLQRLLWQPEHESGWEICEPIAGALPDCLSRLTIDETENLTEPEWLLMYHMLEIPTVYVHTAAAREALGLIHRAVHVEGRDVVRKLARTPGPGSIGGLRAAARECLDVLELLIAENRHRATLLRPTYPDPRDILLRAARPTLAQEPDRLLRPAS